MSQIEIQPEIWDLARRIKADGFTPDVVQVSMAGEDNEDLCEFLKEEYGVEFDPNNLGRLVHLEMAFETVYDEVEEVA